MRPPRRWSRTAGTILSSIVASQVDLHAQFGGVFPEVASRKHIRSHLPDHREALQQAHLNLQDVDAIAVTRGPGLPGSLVVGMNAAKGLALGSGLPLIGVNHLEAHLYSAWLHWRRRTAPPARAGFPPAGADRLGRAHRAGVDEGSPALPDAWAPPWTMPPAKPSTRSPG